MSLPYSSSCRQRHQRYDEPPPQPSSSSSQSPKMKEDKYARFERWLKENGARFDQLELREYTLSDGAPEDANDEDDDDLRRDSSTSYVDDEEKKDPGSTLSPSLSKMEDLHDDDEEDDESEMRGVHTTATLPPSTLIASIPRTCLITVEMGQATPLGRAVLEKSEELDLDAPKHVYLMCYLLWDGAHLIRHRKVGRGGEGVDGAGFGGSGRAVGRRGNASVDTGRRSVGSGGGSSSSGPGYLGSWSRKHASKPSFFQPYYDLLPRTLSNMPVFWSPIDLAHLSGSHLLEQITDRLAAIRSDYESISAAVPLLSQIATLEDFIWARMIVCSRNFGLIVDGKRTSALVPHADMLNHRRPRETKWTFDEDRQAFTVTTLQTIPAGAQVYDSYGQKCNHRFLLNYGFAVERNVELDGFCPNEVPLSLTVDPNDPNWESKMDFWTRGERGVTSSSLAANASLACLTASAGYGVGGGRLGGSSASTAGAAGGAGGAGGTSTALAALMEVANSSSAAGTSAAHSASAALRAAAAASAATADVGTTADVIAGVGHTATPNIPGAVKRIRICASNNDNTRVLFSMLRALSADAEELRLLASPSTASTSLHHTSSSSQPGCVARAVLGLPPSTLSSSAVGGGTVRTCRDVRYPLNLSNERRSLTLLLQIVGDALARYPTTLSRDLADLRDEVAYPPFSNRRNAKVQVRGEKEVLHHFARWARTALDVLEVIEGEVENMAKFGSIHGDHGGSGMSVGEGRAGSTRGYSRLRKCGIEGDDDGIDDDDDIYNDSESSRHNQLGGFDKLVRAMEEDCEESPSSSAVAASSSASALDGSGIIGVGGGGLGGGSGGGVGLHHTIVRYCVDVLGALRREELKEARCRHRMTGGGGR